jgi:exopolysaccharide biosynthesis operon protein EpsL
MRASRWFGGSPQLLALLALLAGGAARADDDGLHLNAGLGWHHDDNLLRVADNDPGYGGQRDDSWRQLDAGATFEHLYGRQRVQASVQLSKVNFDHFTQLDYDGKDARATWFWQLGNQFSGQVGTSYVQLLAPYTDLRTSERNLRTQHGSLFDGAWLMHPRWRARVGLRDDRYSYELSSQRPNDRREQAFEAGVDYLAPSGGEAGLVLRRLQGRYTFRRPFALATDDFDQDEYRLRVNWIASARTSVNLLAGWTSRTQAAYGPGRTSGVTGRLAAAYAPTGKVSVDAAVWRDFAPIESSVVSYTLNRGARIAASWQATAKVRAGASASAEQRDYGARFVLPASLGRVDLDDSLRTAGLNLTYAPMRKVQFGLTLAKEVRGGARVLGIGAYRSTSIGINLSVVL